MRNSTTLNAAVRRRTWVPNPVPKWRHANWSYDYVVIDQIMLSRKRRIWLLFHRILWNFASGMSAYG